MNRIGSRLREMGGVLSECAAPIAGRLVGGGDGEVSVSGIHNETSLTQSDPLAISILLFYEIFCEDFRLTTLLFFYYDRGRGRDYALLMKL